MSSAAWRELRAGYGLERVPRDVAARVCCVECGRPAREPLYTTELRPARTAAALRAVVEAVRRRVWCRAHAGRWFGA